MRVKMKSMLKSSSNTISLLRNQTITRISHTLTSRVNSKDTTNSSRLMKTKCITISSLVIRNKGERVPSIMLKMKS
jgi:hypothetical protein